MKKVFLILSNGAYMPSSTEPCFNSMKIDQTLMNEIKGLGGLSKNQELYIHYMIKKIIGYAELTCTPKVRQKTFGVLLCLKSTGNMAMQND